MVYNPQKIEKKWQSLWVKSKTFQAPAYPPKEGKKFYALEMFPYPSGNLHMGHIRNYTIADVMSRYKAMRGLTVLHPIGWDAFGLPAENAAMAKGISPRTWTIKNIAAMKKQLKAMGFSYDWSREFATCSPDYYKFNQWIFLKFYEKSLVYKTAADVNWCSHCETVLANEQVQEGLCWRCNNHVTIRALDQWFIRISQYAEELLQDLDKLQGHWPSDVITMQKNWIGKSWGAIIDFPIEGDSGKKISVFTTRPDTLFGATFLVISPDHPKLTEFLLPDNKSQVLEYAERVKRLKLQKALAEKEKDGIFTGLYAINPINHEKVPVWCASYVLASYGTGAIMCVPAHDARDFEFAKNYNLNIRAVISPDGSATQDLNKVYEGSGKLVNSQEFNSLESEVAKKKIVEKLASQNLAQEKITYRLRDWLISRQRAWGTPIPVVYCIHCGTVPVSLDHLPVKLPKTIPITGHGESPLKRVKKFFWTKCPHCHKKAQRETDTMDTFVDSSWYYARYLDPKNKDWPFERTKADAWLPVDLYVGGIEHACMHLIYARFFHKALRDLNLISYDEPFGNLFNQGMVNLGGCAMSKSKGNIVEPETITKKYGADALRTFILFAAPGRQSLEWTDGGIEGVWRFFLRLLNMGERLQHTIGRLQDLPGKEVVELKKKLHHTIAVITQDLDRVALNTPVARLMELLNALEDYPRLGDPTSIDVFKNLALLLHPYAPHLTSELLSVLGINPMKLVWPQADPQYLAHETLNIAVQINGKLRDLLELEKDKAINQVSVEACVRCDPKLQKHLQNATLVRVVFVPGKIINFVVKTNEKT